MEGTSVSHYQVEEKIGEGGMGVVYRATDTRLNRQVALKALPESFLEDPQRLARFEREAQLLASLNHTNIAGIHGLETEGDSRYLILELVEGETLAERIDRGRLGLEEALGIAREIAEALEAAHDKGIIHRDLKPANVKITPAGQVKVLDFGLAKALEGATDPASGPNLENSPTLSMAATQAGIILGTAAYMAPEQAAGQPADRRADVWSFGVVLAEMLGGKQLFTGETASHVLAAVLQKEVDLDDALPDVPPPIRLLLERCLEKKPRRRLQAIGEARIAIEDYLADPAAANTPDRAVEDPEEAPAVPAWRRLLPWGLTAALLVASIGLAVTSRRADPPADVVQFTIPPPAGTAFNLNPTSPGPVAVSPDGRHLVFVANGSGGTGLWVRSFEASEARLLAGTEGAAYPFWSPDSRSIGFFADSKLKRIDIAGGPAVSLTEADNGKGGTWSSDGVILFAPTHDAAIHRVAAAGGESVPVTALVPERDISHRHPEFLPDGEHFLYLARIEDPANNDLPEIRLAALEGSDERVLLRSPSAAGYASGYLLYTLESTLMARPFDFDRLEFSGDAVPVADGITLISTGSARSVFSASSAGVLAYQTGANESGAVIYWFDRSGEEAGTVGETARYNEVSLSPDDRRLGVTITDSEAGTRDIWLFDLDRGIPSRFTFDPRHDDSI
ncbi:MAG: protein kinase, partial [Thermoanaerobaculia bacterium]|nr:protein kinase [Thermoanaerobaculia bacterium]